jgi:uncharacterized protein DUF4239
MITGDRWLLNHLPTWQLVPLIVGVFVLIAVLGHVVVRKRFPHVASGEHNDVAGFLLGLVAVLYGIMLGFVVVAVYEEFRAAQDVVRAEATSLSQIYRDTRGFPLPVRRHLDKLMEDYTLTVRYSEWKLMKTGGESEKAWNVLLQLGRALQSWNPRTTSEQIYDAQAATKANDLVAERRVRLSQAEDALPTVFQILLLSGAFLTMGFLYFFGMQSKKTQLVLIGGVAALIGFSIAVVLVLSFPYSGEVSVSNASFHQGALKLLGP